MEMKYKTHKSAVGHGGPQAFHLGCTRTHSDDGLK